MSLSVWLEDTRLWIDRELDRLMPPADAHPERLHQAMRYVLVGRGKRLRPAIVRLVCGELGGEDEDATRPAAAIELVHSYSLVHDDLPCMDDDELRRGRPTCHVAFDEATAILAGDALLTLAFEVLAPVGGELGAELVGVLARGAGAAGMVGGQVLDLTLERAGADLDVLLDMHARKTAALFAAAAEMGAIAAGARDERRVLARAYGRALGLSFQAVDDLLDVTGDARTLGKTPGKDAALARATLVAAVGLERGRAKAQELGNAARASAAALGWGSGALGTRIVDFVLARRA